MDTINLGRLGPVPVHQPAWSTVSDVATSIPTDDTHPAYRARLVRCSAGAIGVAIQRKGWPTYDPTSGDIVAHGGRILDRLIGECGMRPAQVMTAGGAVIRWMVDLLPTEPEVEAHVDFSAAPEDAPTS